MRPGRHRVPTSNGQIPPLVPPAAVPKWKAAEESRAIRKERRAVKLTKSGFATDEKAARAARRQRVPTSNGEIPPLVPPAAVSKWTAAEKLRAIREERLAVKLSKCARATDEKAARAAKKAASALAAAEDARAKREASAKKPWEMERRKYHRPASTASPKRAREVVLEERHLQAVQGAFWAPTVLSVTNFTGTVNRTVFGVRHDHVGPMLWYLAPRLASALGHHITARSVGVQRDLDSDDTRTARRTRTEVQAYDTSRVGREKGGVRDDDGSYWYKQQTQRRGAGVICTINTWSTSGPHRDESDSILLVACGQRTVYFAPSRPDDTADRDDTLTGAGGPPFLPARLDPCLHSTVGMTGVRWCSEPAVLECGDAMWIPRGWWHCVRSEAGSVAVPIEVEKDSVSGAGPCVWRAVATARCHHDGAPRQLRHAPTWRSAANVRAMWLKTLEPR
jgi:hypothetical protein